MDSGLQNSSPSSASPFLSFEYGISSWLDMYVHTPSADVILYVDESQNRLYTPLFWSLCQKLVASHCLEAADAFIPRKAANRVFFTRSLNSIAEEKGRQPIHSPDGWSLHQAHASSLKEARRRYRRLQSVSFALGILVPRPDITTVRSRSASRELALPYHIMHSRNQEHIHCSVQPTDEQQRALQSFRLRHDRVLCLGPREEFWWIREATHAPVQPQSTPSRSQSPILPSLVPPTPRVHASLRRKRPYNNRKGQYRLLLPAEESHR